MARKEAALKKFMFVSDYDPAHYNWTPEELSALGDPKKTALILMKRLNKNNIKIKGMYAIQHRSEKKGYFWASNLHEKDSAFREYQEAIHTKQHIHVLIFFEDGYETEKTKLSEIMGISKSALDNIKFPDGCFAYLCHSKYEDKYQYPPTDVITLVGTDFKEIYDKNIDKWLASRKNTSENAKKKNRKKIFKEILQRLETGEITYDDICADKNYYPLVCDTYYNRQIKRKIKLLEEINLNNLKTLTKILIEKKITTIDKETLSEPLYRAYLSEKHAIDKAIQLNFTNLDKSGFFYEYDPLANEYYLYLYGLDENSR